jgi:hypothetical protein
MESHTDHALCVFGDVLSNIDVFVVFVGSAHKFMGFLHSFGHLVKFDSVNVGSILNLCWLFLHPLFVFL